MTGKISLTASMRSNLLSLQNISRQVSSTQNKLATGNKVNSAIDNPSSYYTARSLTNRANDLDSLLDSMGQAVSTIKTATTALETGATFLEQAAAVANSALEAPQTIPNKEFFTQLIGANDAVVSSAEELDQALAAGKETIVVYGKINLNHAIQLKDNQKMVGINYFANFTGSDDYFSELNYTSNANENMISVVGNNTKISNLNINYDNEVGVSFGNSVIFVSLANGKPTNTKFANLNINFQTNGIPKAGAACIKTYGKDASAEINGNIKLQTQAWGIFAEASSKIEVIANLDISATQGINAHNSSRVLLNSETMLKIKNANVAFSLVGGAAAIDIADGVYIGISENNRLYNINNTQMSAANNIMSLSKGVVFVNYSTKQAYYLDATTNLTSTGQATFNKFISNLVTKDVDYNQVAQQIEDSFSANYSGLFSWQNKIKQYANILNQYDSITKDASYKGVNLLKKDKLNVRFNESGNADLNVIGKDMSSAALGLGKVDWANQSDIAQSLKEIASALKSIRAFTAELGNNYSIITSRQDFTENLINILTEGADKLTLADMNEESANMLALQTRQQLAINSLSLASQAAQAVMKLF